MNQTIYVSHHVSQRETHSLVQIFSKNFCNPLEILENTASAVLFSFPQPLETTPPQRCGWKWSQAGYENGSAEAKIGGGKWTRDR